MTPADNTSSTNAGTGVRALAVPPTADTVRELPEILDRVQAAWLLQITPGRLDAGTIRGDIPGRKIGRNWRYSKTALLALVQ